MFLLTVAQLEAVLGVFYAPAAPLSDVVILEYRELVSKYARRFFHHLLRYCNSAFPITKCIFCGTHQGCEIRQRNGIWKELWTKILHCSYFNSSKMEIRFKCICSYTVEALSHSWGKAPHMHLFGLLFHFPFYHESPLKCLFDWNRPCCSHTLLWLLSISQLPPVWSLFSFCSSAAELVHCLASLLLSSLITYLHSFSLIQHQMKEPPHPSTHTLSLCWCLFVSCWLQTGKVEVFLCWEIQDSLPALILDNRKLTDCFLFSYWQLCLQRCLQMCGCNSVCRLEEEINQ